MKKYIAKRIMLMFVTAFVTMTALFVLIRLLPNHVHAALGGYAKQEEMMREAWGYNKPIIVQYGIFLKNVLTKQRGCAKIRTTNQSGLTRKVPLIIS